MRTLYVLYDPHCGLCTQVKSWLLAQPALVPMHLLAAGSPEAKRLFPAISGGKEVTVISDQGYVWRGDAAWVVCLWALRYYRDWSKRLASPLLLPFAKQAFAAVSHHRRALSGFLGLRSEAEMAEALRNVELPVCEIPAP